ncbi:uncharacterized protein J3R85_012698 [Psidium guajava]|nr:uncharacterized protein J3R85_012698 [Psidium guajava]
MHATLKLATDSTRETSGKAEVLLLAQAIEYYFKNRSSIIHLHFTCITNL